MATKRGVVIHTVEMHTGGEPLRIIQSGRQAACTVVYVGPLSDNQCTMNFSLFCIMCFSPNRFPRVGTEDGLYERHVFY